jgi:hypothetical protein
MTNGSKGDQAHPSSELEEKPGSRAPGGRARRAVLVATILVATVGYLSVMHAHYPIEQWLVWRYLRAWLVTLYWAGGCLSFGYAIIDRLFAMMRLREKLLFAFVTGVYGFFVAMSIAGWLQLFGATLAMVLPGLMVASGARRLWRVAVRVRRGLRVARTLHGQTPSPLYLFCFAFGALCIAGLYLNILTPKNLSFDTVWYHLGLGQQFSAAGGIVASPEGAFVSTLPQLTAILFTWAFLIPGSTLIATAATAAHMEFVVFLATLASIPLVVRFLLPTARVPLAWTALFLFPAIFVYDAGLVAGADHIAALWAVPIFLALRRAWRRLEPRDCGLLALCMVGAVVTKYQAASLVMAPAIAILYRAVRAAMKRDSSHWIAGPLTALGLGLLFSAPHWLKNLLWHGDPLYPALYHYLPLRPWSPDASAMMDLNWKRLVWRPRGTAFEQLKETLVEGTRFAFRAHARKQFHGKIPIFGALFTLSLVWLPFLRRTKRVWALAVSTQLGVFTWYYLSHVERYLQALVPWMAAAVAACIFLAWREGWLARASVVLLVLVQLVWGGDTYFFPTHSMMRDAPIRETAKLIGLGYRKKFKQRDTLGGTLADIGRRLPTPATVLLHEHNPRFGLNAAVVTDMAGFQGRISYGSMKSAADVHALFVELGVSHLVWRPARTRALDSIAGDLRFFEYVTLYAKSARQIGSMMLAPMPATAPSQRATDRVAYMGCGPTFSRGIYTMSDMNVPRGAAKQKIAPREALPSDGKALSHALATVDFVVHVLRCKVASPTSALDHFVKIAKRKQHADLWARRPGTP